MMSKPSLRSARRARSALVSRVAFWHLAATLLASCTCQARSAHAAFSYSVGPQEVIYIAAQRKSLGLNSWPDGNLGVVPLGGGQYDFYAPNASTPVKTTGSLTSPGKAKSTVQISG